MKIDELRHDPRNLDGDQARREGPEDAKLNGEPEAFDELPDPEPDKAADLDESPQCCPHFWD